jgi:N-6 DNA Methylase
MPAAISQHPSLSERAKAAIETMGSALLRQHSDPAAIDPIRFTFELRVVLQRMFTLEAVGQLDAVLDSADAWAKVLEMDLENEMFHVEQLGSDRIWSAEWVGLVRREFGLCGGSWFEDLVDAVRGDSAQMGAVDESLMGWHATIEGEGLRLVAEDGSDRKTGGVFYTPASLVGYVLDQALNPAIEACGDDVDRLLELRVCDPACGCGYFLIEAAKRIVDQVIKLGGVDMCGEVIRSCIYGGDVNPMTAEICRWSLWLAADDEDVTIEDLRSRVVCADSLVDGVLEDSFDVVVGNPPFLNQLGSGTARSTDRVQRLREQGLVGAATYTDEASAFFVLGLQMAKVGGRVCMVQPQSVIATRGGAHARERAMEMGWLESLWVSNEHVFGDASVYTCGPCVVVGGVGDRVERYSSGEFVEHAAISITADEMRSLETWSSIAAVTMGVPEVAFESAGVVGDVARATADFRDEYYGLTGCIVDDAEGRGGIKLLTTGLVDLARCWWGEKTTRILKQRWESPRVDEGNLRGDARLQRWVELRGVEKVVVATQTKVIEAFVDPRGEYAAVTPMISVMTDGSFDVWKLGAAIGSPVCSMFAMRQFGGAAMHADALKMSARQVMELPIPIDERAWDEGTAMFEQLHDAKSDEAYGDELRCFGAKMCDAYQVGGRDQDVLMGWWLGRLGYKSLLLDR